MPSAVPGMRGPVTRAPLCSVHGERAQRGRDGWFCRTCLNEHIHRKRKGKSIRGVILPASVSDKLPVPDYASEILPNRAARRRR